MTKEKTASMWDAPRGVKLNIDPGPAPTPEEARATLKEVKEKIEERKALLKGGKIIVRCCKCHKEEERFLITWKRCPYGCVCGYTMKRVDGEIRTDGVHWKPIEECELEPLISYIGRLGSSFAECALVPTNGGMWFMPDGELVNPTHILCLNDLPIIPPEVPKVER